MPELKFKGKSIIRTHHLTLPYRQLKPSPSKSRNKKPSLDDNLIIHGDNLLALKSLLPSFSGKIKCIYIDPPYNTGNTGEWKYDDSVNSPMHQEWLGKEVDRDDLTRHEKWLCMMWPRLILLRDLLREDGVIFVSIDDNEVHHLRAIMDEIFGEDNFVDAIIWKKRYGGGAKEKYLVSVHEYILFYAKSVSNLDPIFVPSSPASIERYYKMKDDKFETRGPYRTHPLEATKSMGERKNLVFPIPAPDGSQVLPKRQWLWSKERVMTALEDGELEFSRTEKGWTVHTKQYLKDKEGNTRQSKAFSLIDNVYTQHGTNEIIEMFGNAQVFPFAKPTNLIKTLVQVASSEENDDLFLDSFAGSGTTGQAVLALNAEDGGNRKFILIEQEDYADTITAERVRRVMKGVPNARDEQLKKGYGGTFSYFTLGPALDDDSVLKGDHLPSYLDLARYVFFTATGEQLDESQVDESRNYLGESRQYSVYLLYKPNVEFLKTMPLNLDFAEALPSPETTTKTRLVIGSHKYLDDDRLRVLKIEFCQLPFSIYRFRAR